MSTESKRDEILEWYRTEKTLSPHQRIEVANAIDAGLLDNSDFIDDFKDWVNDEGLKYEGDSFMDFDEHYQNLLTHRQNYEEANLTQNKEEKFLEWAGHMNLQTIYGAPKYNSDEVIDFQKYYDANLSDEENEKRFKDWVDNEYSL